MPNDRYCAEAYGTRKTVTAAGIYPYEGTRVVETQSNEIIWGMTPEYGVIYSEEDSIKSGKYEEKARDKCGDGGGAVWLTAKNVQLSLSEL